MVIVIKKIVIQTTEGRKNLGNIKGMIDTEILRFALNDKS